MADKYEMKDMTGAVFVNKDKKTDNHPDRRGTIKVRGVEYRISGWLKKSKNGESYMSVAISEMREKSAGGNSQDDGGLGHKDYGDDF